MGSDHPIYTCGSYHNSLHKSFLDQQQSYLSQQHPGGEMSIAAGVVMTCVDAAIQSAGLPPVHFGESWDGHNFLIGGSLTAAAAQYQVSPYRDGSDAQETPSTTSPHILPTGPIAYPSTFITGFLNPTTPQVIRPSYSIFTSNGVQRYRCVCGHEALKKGDMRRHHESSNHSHRKYFCTLCEKLFTRKDGLRRHKIKKHPRSDVVGFTASGLT